MTRPRERWLTVAGLYLALSLIYAWPVVGSFGSVLPSDLGDPGLNTWILWWNAHAVPLTTRWWDGPMFFPVHGAMALSETLFGIAWLTTPMQWLGASAVVAYNTAFILSFVAAALAAHLLAHRLTGRHDAALVAGLAFGFSPYRAAQLPHVQVLSSYFAPLALFALHRYLDTRRLRMLLLFAVCWLLNGLMTGYFLVYFAVLVGLWMIFFLRTLRDWIAVGVTIAIASLPIVPVVIGYVRHQTALGLVRDAAEIQTFSADLTAIWATSTNSWLPSYWTVAPGPEGELYPGIAVLVLVILAAVAAWRHRQKIASGSWIRRALAIVGGLAVAIAIAGWVFGEWSFKILGQEVSGRHPYKTFTIGFWCLTLAAFWDRRFIAGWRRRSPMVFYAIAAGVTFVLALGPTGRAFHQEFLNGAPYNLLLTLPGGHSLRAPARFATFFILCLSEVAALAFARLFRSGVSAAVVGVIAVAVGIDGWVTMLPTARVPRDVNLSGISPAAVVMELPFEDVYSDTAAMLRATKHGHALVNGYSGYFPAHYEPLVTGMDTGDVDVLDAIRRFAPLAVVVNGELDRDGSAKNFMDGVAGNERTRAGQSWIYRLSKLPDDDGRDITQPIDPEIPVASVSANSSDENTFRMIDKDITTRWESFGHQAPGQEIHVRLAHPATISQVELDLGKWQLDYPRGLRIAVVDSAGAAQTKWEHGTAAEAMRGALFSLIRMPVSISLPPNTTGQEIVLTMTGSHGVYSWSIAELRVYGR